MSALLLLQLGIFASCPFISVSGSIISVIPCRYTSGRLLFDSASCFVFSRPENPISLSFSFCIGCSTHLTILLVLCWTCCRLTIPLLYWQTGTKLDTDVKGLRVSPLLEVELLGLRTSTLLEALGRDCQTALWGHHSQG